MRWFEYVEGAPGDTVKLATNATTRRALWRWRDLWWAATTGTGSRPALWPACSTTTTAATAKPAKVEDHDGMIVLRPTAKSKQRFSKSRASSTSSTHAGNFAFAKPLAMKLKKKTALLRLAPSQALLLLPPSQAQLLAPPDRRRHFTTRMTATSSCSYWYQNRLSSSSYLSWRRSMYELFKKPFSSSPSLPSSF